jgi:hypothetical protein
MSEEYENIEQDSATFSPFYPLLVLMIGLILWTGYQVYVANSQRNAFSQQIQQAAPAINQAVNIRDRYVALMKDLIETSSKDQYAAGIVKEAQQAGWLKVNQNQAPAAPASDAGAGTNAAPADSSAPAK